MAESGFWIAQVPFAEGQVGTGPVDLSLATQVLSAPNGFDLPGGAGVLFDRAYWWFTNAAQNATSETARSDNYLGAVYALNNFAVWCMTRLDDPSAPQQTYDALLEAERILNSDLPDFGLVRGGVLVNLGNLMEMIGRRDESDEYRRMARSLGQFASSPSAGAPEYDSSAASAPREQARVHIQGSTQTGFATNPTLKVYWNGRQIGNLKSIGGRFAFDIEADGVLRFKWAFRSAVVKVAASGVSTINLSWDRVSGKLIAAKSSPTVSAGR